MGYSRRVRLKVGCARCITESFDGEVIKFREILTKISPEEHMFKYKLDESTPVPPFTNGAKLNAVGENTELVWTYECPADPTHPDLEQIILIGFYQSSIDKLKSTV